MAYTVPTKATFIAIFPSFAAVEDEAYAFWSAQAALITEPLQDCLGARMDLATMRATAWYLTDAGIGTGAESQMAAQGASGFKRIKSGLIDLEKADAASYAEDMKRQREEAKKRAEEAKRRSAKANRRKRAEESDEEDALAAMTKSLEEQEAAEAAAGTKDSNESDDDQGGGFVGLKRKPKKRFMF